MIDENIDKLFSRNCPKCDELIFHTNINNRNMADRKQRLCKICGNLLRANNRRGKPAPWNSNPLSEEHKKAVSKSLKGREFSDEHRKKLSEAQRGELNHEYGKKQSKETRLKKSIAKKGKRQSEKTINKRKAFYHIKYNHDQNSWTRGQLRYWRDRVLKRDNFTCQICFSHLKSDLLHAHHIFQKALYPEKALNINNGIALCYNCNRFVHSVLKLL